MKVTSDPVSTTPCRCGERREQMKRIQEHAKQGDSAAVLGEVNAMRATLMEDAKNNFDRAKLSLRDFIRAHARLT